MMIPRSQGRINSSPQLRQSPAFSGLSNLGQAIGGVVDARNELATKEAKVKVDDILTVELSEQVTKLKNDVANGAMGAEDANKLLSGWSEKRFKEIENDLPQHARQDLKNHWTSNVNRNGTGFLPLQLRADEQRGLNVADRMTEIATRMPRQQGAEYLKNNISTLNIPEHVKQQRLSTYNTSMDLIEIDSRITKAIETKNTQDLQALVGELDQGKYGYLDGQQAQQKKAQAQSRIDAINKQVEVEENKRVQMAGKVFGDFKTQVLTGRMLDEEYSLNVEKAVSGTEHESEFKFYKQQSNNFQHFNQLSTTEQLKRINQQKSKMANSPSADPATEEKILGVFESLHAEKLENIKKNPNQAVSEAGLKVHTLSSSELRSSPKSFVSKLIDNGVNQIALKDANLSVRPISEEDLPEARKAFEAMPVNEKLNFIGELIGQSKGVQDGSSLWGSALGQLGSGDLSYVMAGVARMNNYRSTKGEDVATAIVSGTQALKNKQLILPKDDLLRQEFGKYVGTSVTGTTANMSFSAFKSIYAHLTERDNYQHKDKDDINKNLVSTALSMATGGVYKQNVKYGQSDWKVSKPYGMDDTNFESHLEKGYNTIAKQTGLSVAELQDLRLRRSDKRSARGEIQYDLINERGTPLIVNGAIWRINLNGVTK
ncbi:methyl-coenzyme M reductase [Acinetobacter sp. Ver3]|nr:methyl-coenzyme M reductase [Acinetobacter sp. Ver3]